MANPDQQVPSDESAGERVPDKSSQRPPERPQSGPIDPEAASATSDDVTKKDEPAEPPPGADSELSRTVDLTDTPPPAPRTVELTEIGEYKTIKRIKAKGTFLQETGRDIFKWMLWLTTFVLVALFTYLIWETLRVPQSIPRLPADSASVVRDTVVARLLLEQRQAVFDNFATGVEKVVIAFLLPLLTAILGYLFGTHAGAASETKAGSHNESEG